MLETALTFFENNLNLSFFQKSPVILKKELSANYSVDDELIMFIFHIIAADGSNKVSIELLCATQDNLVQSIRYEQDTLYHSPTNNLLHTVFTNGKKAKESRISYWQQITGHAPQKRVFATIDKRTGGKAQIFPFKSSCLSPFIRSFIDLINMDQCNKQPRLSIPNLHFINRFLRAHL